MIKISEVEVTAVLTYAKTEQNLHPINDADMLDDLSDYAAHVQRKSETKLTPEEIWTLFVNSTLFKTHFPHLAR